MKITITVPNAKRAETLAALAEVPHVTMPTATAPGKAVPPDGGGTEFTFIAPLNSDNIEVTVTQNPHNLTADYIKGRLDSDVSHKFAGYRGKF